MTLILVDFRPQLCPTRDQGPTESCVSHATSTAHEHARKLPEALSAEFLHYHATSGSWDKPISLDRVAVVLEAIGQPLEGRCAPFTASSATTWRPPTRATLHRRKTVRLPAKPDNAFQAIRAGDLPILGIGVPAGFYAPGPPWVIPPDGSPKCLHAVLGVGYGTLATGERAVLIRNSWGGDWGEDGHAWLSESFLSRHLKDLAILGVDVT